MPKKCHVWFVWPLTIKNNGFKALISLNYLRIKDIFSPNFALSEIVLILKALKIMFQKGKNIFVTHRGPFIPSIEINVLFEWPLMRKRREDLRHLKMLSRHKCFTYFPWRADFPYSEWPRQWWNACISSSVFESELRRRIGPRLLGSKWSRCPEIPNSQHFLNEPERKRKHAQQTWYQNTQNSRKHRTVLSKS